MLRQGAMRIPYRNSKLTRLLQSSLAGNCKATFVVSLRSEKKNTEEAIGTLRFAQRAKSVEATVVKNEDVRKPKESGVANKKLADELSSAKESLAEFESKLATAESYKASLMAEVHTLLGEMHSLQHDSEEAAKRQAPPRTAQAYPGYVQALERRITRLEEENRLLRQRDIMHRLMDLDASAGGAAVAAPPTTALPEQLIAAPGAPAAPAELKLQFSRGKLATFEPMAIDTKPLVLESARLGVAASAFGTAGFDVIVQRESSGREDSYAVEQPARRSKQQLQPASPGGRSPGKRHWMGSTRAAAYLVGSVLVGKRNSARVQPEGGPAKPGAPKKRASPFATMNESAAAAAAAAVIQARWREKLAREDAFWDMMGYGWD